MRRLKPVRDRAHLKLHGTRSAKAKETPEQNVFELCRFGT
jgi:hypothetical protein